MNTFATILANTSPTPLPLEKWERDLIQRLRVLRAGKKYATLLVRFDGRLAQVLEARPAGSVKVES